MPFRLHSKAIQCALVQKILTRSSLVKSEAVGQPERSMTDFPGSSEVVGERVGWGDVINVGIVLIN